MAEVLIEIAGRNYPVTCRDGEEEHLRAIARLVDAKAQDAQRSVGGVNETRHLLFAALLLADEIKELREAGPGGAPASTPVARPQALQPDMAPIIEKLAERMESLAERLETPGANA